MVDQVLAQPEGSKLMLLAPVVRDRKGEHTKLLENLAAQGYIRARIDGEVCDLSDPPALELHKKHTIEVVVDRFKVRDDLALRLAESFETALTLSGGIVLVVPMDGEEGVAPMTFSANFACPECGYSMSELEPRIFSFNNPAGACPTCDGLGVQQYFDPAKVTAIRPSVWPMARSAAGTSAASTTSKCSNPSPSTTSSTWRRRGKICRSRPRR